jgi:hypothetical protein
LPLRVPGFESLRLYDTITVIFCLMAPVYG